MVFTASLLTHTFQGRLMLKACYPSAPEERYSEVYPTTANPRIREIADLFTELIQLFIDMRYLDASIVRFPPHCEAPVDLTGPLVYGLAKDVVDLWQMIPHVPWPGNPNWGDERCFLMDGSFLSGILEGDLMDWEHAAIDPFHSLENWNDQAVTERSKGDTPWNDRSGPYIKPHYAVLNSVGTYGSTIIVDTKKYRLWYINQCSGRGTSDPGIGVFPDTESDSSMAEGELSDNDHPSDTSYDFDNASETDTSAQNDPMTDGELESDEDLTEANSDDDLAHRAPEDELFEKEVLEELAHLQADTDTFNAAQAPALEEEAEADRLAAATRKVQLAEAGPESWPVEPRNSYHLSLRPSRDACEFLRDIMYRFRSLDWIPGGYRRLTTRDMERRGCRQDAEYLKFRDLYLAAGWPSTFNPHKFDELRRQAEQKHREWRQRVECLEQLEAMRQEKVQRQKSEMLVRALEKKVVDMQSQLHDILTSVVAKPEGKRKRGSETIAGLDIEPGRVSTANVEVDGAINVDRNKRRCERLIRTLNKLTTSWLPIHRLRAHGQSQADFDISQRQLRDQIDKHYRDRTDLYTRTGKWSSTTLDDPAWQTAHRDQALKDDYIKLTEILAQDASPLLREQRKERELKHQASLLNQDDITKWEEEQIDGNGARWKTEKWRTEEWKPWLNQSRIIFDPPLLEWITTLDE